jgi:hypothetical protein
MKLSVESEALVMPRRSGFGGFAAAVHHFLVLFHEAEPIDLLPIDGQVRKSVLPTRVTRTERSIWRQITSMCLSLMATDWERQTSWILSTR